MNFYDQLDADINKKDNKENIIIKKQITIKPNENYVVKPVIKTPKNKNIKWIHIN